MKVDFIVERAGTKLLIGQTKGAVGFEYQYEGEDPVCFDTPYEMAVAVKALAGETSDGMNHRAGCAKEAYPTILAKWAVETDGLAPLPRSMFVEPVVEVDDEVDPDRYENEDGNT